MSVTQGRLQRSLAGMTFGVAREMQERRDRLALSALAEREQEFQIPIHGSAGAVAAWAEVELTFRLEFVPATGQRDSPYVYPTMTSGYELLTPDPVAVLAHVAEWKVSDRGIVFGAKVKVCAWLPQGGELAPYRGLLHLIFSGYGAPTESELEDDE